MTSPSSWSLSGPSLPACLPPKSSSDVGMRTMQRAINSSQLLSLFLCLRGPSGPARPGSRDGRRVEVSIWCVCVCLVEEGGGSAQSSESNAPGKKKSAARRSSHHKNIMKRDPGSTFYFSFFSISIRAGWLLTIKRPSR